MSRPRTFQDARCLITGASSGLGRALAEALVRAGARVVLTGRSAERLDALVRGLISNGARPEALDWVVADLTRPDDRRRLFDITASRFGALDLVVNSAGVGAYGRFESHDESVLREVFEINLFALAEICRAALPLLRLGDHPALVNFGSIVARRALPGRPEYSASKFAVAGLTESLRAEWAIDGISVLLVNPGFTATAFESNLVVDTAIYKTHSHREMTAEQVALATLKALRQDRHELTLSPGGRLLLLVNRLMPRFVDWGLGRWTRRLYADPRALALAERRTWPPESSTIHVAARPHISPLSGHSPICPSPIPDRSQVR
jgi:short-subunit dehydrogenase